MGSKTVLITRAMGDEAELTEALHARDFSVIHEPLTQIFLLHTARTALERALFDEPDAIIATSRHGVMAMTALTQLRDSPLICVGEATAQVAENAGFTRVYDAGGDVYRLSDYLAAAYDPGSRFVYVSAQQVRVDLASLLDDMQVDRIVVYEAAAVTELSDTLPQQLKRGQIDAVTFFSQRTAAIFANLLSAAGLEESAQSLHAFVLSDAVAEPIMPLRWRGIHVASEPTLASLVASVDNILHG